MPAPSADFIHLIMNAGLRGCVQEEA
eukprot:SAG11_NODE_28019_length_326_cov_0.841410_1_plen_25_part_10